MNKPQSRQDCIQACLDCVIAYVADFYNHRVQKFTPEGRFVAQWGGGGRGNGRFHYPTDVAVGPRGDV